MRPAPAGTVGRAPVGEPVRRRPGRSSRSAVRCCTCCQAPVAEEVGSRAARREAPRRWVARRGGRRRRPRRVRVGPVRCRQPVGQHDVPGGGVRGDAGRRQLLVEGEAMVTHPPGKGGLAGERRGGLADVVDAGEPDASRVRPCRRRAARRRCVGVRRGSASGPTAVRRRRRCRRGAATAAANQTRCAMSFPRHGELRCSALQSRSRRSCKQLGATFLRPRWASLPSNVSQLSDTRPSFCRSNLKITSNRLPVCPQYAIYRRGTGDDL